METRIMQLHSLKAPTSIHLFSLNNNFYFYKAAFNGHVDAIEVLLKAGANIEAKKTSDGATALSAGINPN